MAVRPHRLSETINAISIVATDIGAFEAEASLCDGDGGNQLICTDCPCANNALFGTVGAITGVLRHGARAVASDGAMGVTTPTFGRNVAGEGLGTQAGFQVGTLRYFQCFYREQAGAGCQTLINTTQALRVVFES